MRFTESVDDQSGTGQVMTKICEPMDNLGEDSLFFALKRGDIAAYEAVFKRYYKSLVVEAYYLLKDEAEAEDQVQQFFVEAYSTHALSSIRTSVKAYLHTSIRNKCLNLLAKRKVENCRRESYLQTETGQQIGADITLENRELSEKMERAISKLPYRRLQAVKLVYLEERKYQEAADMLGISVNSIKTHLRLALEALRKDFKKF